MENKASNEKYLTELNIHVHFGSSLISIANFLIKQIRKEANYPEILLITRAAIMYETLMRLFPLEEVVKDENSLVDTPTIYSIARNISEVFYMYYFLCVEEVSEDEKDFRRLYSYYHSQIEQEKMGIGLGIKGQEMEEHRTYVKTIRNKIEKNLFFKTLEFKKQNYLLKGKSPIYMTRSEMNKKIGLSDELLSALYKVQSNFTHPQTWGLLKSFNNITHRDCKETRMELTGLLFFTNFLASSLIVWVNSIIDVKKMVVLQICTYFRLCL